MTPSSNAHNSEVVEVGTLAPDFSLPFATQGSIAEALLTLSVEVEKEPIVLAFYPADWSPGCTREVCVFRDATSDPGNPKQRIWAISGDYTWSHHAWAKHLNLPFELLSDHDHTVAKLYGSFNPDSGKNRRSIFVIGTDRKVLFANSTYNVRTDDDYEVLKEVLAGIN